MSHTEAIAYILNHLVMPREKQLAMSIRYGDPEDPATIRDRNEYRELGQAMQVLEALARVPDPFQRPLL
jgi:hypothetical protein